MKEIKKPKDDRLIISEHLKKRGIKQSWLAARIGVSPSHLHFILKMQRELTPVNLDLIKKALNLNWEQN